MHYFLTGLLICAFHQVLSQTPLVFDTVFKDSCTIRKVRQNLQSMSCVNQFKKITRKGLLKNNQKHGHWMFFDNDMLVYEGTYIKNKKCGFWKEYYISGHEVFIGKYKKELMTGTWKMYYNPQADFRKEKKIDKKYLTKIEKYKNGKLQGKYTEFHENGNIKITGRYKNNIKTGLWKCYNEKGKLISSYGQ